MSTCSIKGKLKELNSNDLNWRLKSLSCGKTQKLYFELV
jgi:hypothetical protein